MAAIKTLSRRALFGTLAGAALAPFGRTAPASCERRYRADAQVLFFGVPLVHRQGVGGASAVWRESDSTVRTLEFTGYSSPDRAAGLNRMGFLKETARPGECVYFGLMTASPEESAEQARNALRPAQKEQAYTAIDGRISSQAIETAIAHFTAPAAVSGEHSQELVERARQALASAERVASPDLAGVPASSFLQALADLLQRPDGNDGRYIYSGRLYRMRLSRTKDESATAHFREPVIRVAGRVRREAGGKETDFRLWIPEGGARPLPLRIEYQPKSYLRLTFEAVG
jgi:hypothetical protein